MRAGLPRLFLLAVLGAGIFGICVLGACGGEPLGSAAQAIVGAGVTAASDAEVVMIQIRQADGTPGICTGVVVAPRMVLTAAHCVSRESVGKASFVIFIGQDSHDMGGDSVAVARVVVDPEFDSTSLDRGHDVAALITDQNIGITPASTNWPALDGVTQVRVVGYGLADKTTVESAGQRRQATIPLSSADDLFIILGEGATPCLGDSGAPVFAISPDGSEALAGIVSYTNDECGPFAHVTRLSAYADFVREQIAAAGEPASGCNVTHAQPDFIAMVLLLLIVLRSSRACT